jgi:hypothetical protein
MRFSGLFKHFAALGLRLTAGKHCCSDATAFQKATVGSGKSLHSAHLGQMTALEFVDRKVAEGSGGKSDPPVGTGRGLKLRASKAAARPSGSFRAVLFFCPLEIFFGKTIFASDAP